MGLEVTTRYSSGVFAARCHKICVANRSRVLMSSIGCAYLLMLTINK
jgi:hypothetical protein